MAEGEERRVEPDAIQDAIEALIEGLEEGLLKNPSLNQEERREWLRTLYGVHAARVSSSDRLIWGTAKVMIPASYLFLTVLFFIESPTSVHAYLLATASIFTMVAWLFIAENSRALRNKSWAWMRAIERVNGIRDPTGPRIADNPLNVTLTFHAAGQWLRWFIMMLLIVMWFIAITGLYLGKL